MVSLEKSANIVAWTLISLIHRDTVINEFEWVDHKGDAIQKGFFVVFQTILILHIMVEFFLIRSRDNIPSLYRSLMVVI